LFLAIYLDELAIGVFLVCALLVGLWSCAVTARNLNTADPSCIVWDEVLAFWLVLWLITPTGWIEQLLAFGLFRFFDIVKPGPVAWADRLFHADGSVQIHGYKASAGILLDDLVAAFCTLLVIALGRTMLGLMGILP
jgi:phosphatidylglycerophosphatase A